MTMLELLELLSEKAKEELPEDRRKSLDVILELYKKEYEEAITKS